MILITLSLWRSVKSLGDEPNFVTTAPLRAGLNTAAVMEQV